MIPKIIHQIWIGPKESPTKPMDSWKNKNPDFEYILMCNKICGASHYKMNMPVHVGTQKEFDAWVRPEEMTGPRSSE